MACFANLKRSCEPDCQLNAGGLGSGQTAIVPKVPAHLLSCFFFGLIFLATRFLGMSVIGLWPAILEPRSAATRRRSASSLLYCSSLLDLLAMTCTPTDRDPFSIACELVGRYQYHFSKIEGQLDRGVAKVLDLKDGADDIVCANLDFAKKLNIIRSAVALQFTDTTGKLSGLLNRVSGVNNPDRQTVIHSTFEPSDGGVRFSRLIARDELQRINQDWDEPRFTQAFRNMQELTEELGKVVADLKPYLPSLDFSDARNSGLFHYFT
jgi:hypothetical protein